jgi:hypothetical protein
VHGFNFSMGVGEPLQRANAEDEVPIPGGPKLNAGRSQPAWIERVRTPYRGLGPRAREVVDEQRLNTGVVQPAFYDLHRTGLIIQLSGTTS